MAKLGNNEIIPGFDDGRDPEISILLERTDVESRCLKVHLSGRIDTYNTSYFQKAVDSLVASGFVYLVFCCAGLGYVSSSGIGAFTKLHQAVKGLGGELFMVDLKPQVYDIFNILGYTNYFSFRETADDAIENLRHYALRRASTATLFPLSFSCPACGTKLKTRSRASSCARPARRGSWWARTARRGAGPTRISSRSDAAVRRVGAEPREFRQGAAQVAGVPRLPAR